MKKLIVIGTFMSSVAFAQDLTIDCQVNGDIKGVNTFSMKSTFSVNGDLYEGALIEDVELKLNTVKASYDPVEKEVSIRTNVVVTEVELSTYNKPVYNVVLRSNSDDVYLPVWGKLNAGFTLLSSYVSLKTGYFKSTCTVK